MERQAQAKLMVAGIPHSLDQALVLSRTMPKIELKASELCPFDEVAVATIEPADPKMNHGEAVVFKREGKWMLLWGRETARRAIEQGLMHLRVTLMSSQALKRCKVESFKHPDDGKQLPPPPPTYGDEFRNAPRMSAKHQQGTRRDPLYDHARRIVDDGGIPAGKMGIVSSETSRTDSSVKKIESNIRRGPYGNIAVNERKSYREKQ